MKKKAIALLLLFSLAFSLSSCGSSDSGNESSKSNDSQAVAKQENQLTDAEISNMYSEPGKYKDRSIELTGKVFSEPEYEDNDVYFQMWADPENSERNTIVKYSGGEVKPKDGDYIKLSGYVHGTFEGENVFGVKITCPKIFAESLEIVSYKDVVAPTISEIKLDEPTQEQYGYSVTIQKVELAEKETRVYIKVDNSGREKFNLYSFNSVIIQDGKQFEEEKNYSADYPEVQTGLNVGVSTEGVFCFPAIGNSDFQIILEGSSENYEEKLKPFVFDVIV